MGCAVCGNRGFRRTSYRTHHGTCPALTCLACQAITLDEAAAKNDEERASVRIAIAARRHVADASA